MVKHLDVRIDLGAESGQDARTSVQAAEGRLHAIRDRIRETSAAGDGENRMDLLLEEGSLLVELERMTDAWDCAKNVFEASVREQQWQNAAHACELMFRSEQPLSLAALGQGIWGDRDLHRRSARGRCTTRRTQRRHPTNAHGGRSTT